MAAFQTDQNHRVFLEVMEDFLLGLVLIAKYLLLNVLYFNGTPSLLKMCYCMFLVLRIGHSCYKNKISSCG